jgi:hypothetical protein
MHIERAEVTIDGRTAVTIGLAAHERGTTRETTQRAIHRAVAAGKLQPLPPEELAKVGWDARVPLFWADEAFEVLGNRPGRGANLRRPT